MLEPLLDEAAGDGGDVVKGIGNQAVDTPRTVKGKEAKASVALGVPSQPTSTSHAHTHSVIEDETEGGEITATHAHAASTLLFPAVSKTRNYGRAHDPREWKRKVAMGGLFFFLLTCFFIILALASDHMDPDRYAEPRCAGCDVIGSVAANLAQALLPLVYLTALGVAWWVEKPRRSLRQFAVDNMKQLVSGAITHFEATAFAVLMYNNAYNGKISECDWYLIIFMLDTAYGCFLTVSLHAWTVRMAARTSWAEPLSRLGDYYGKPGPDGQRQRVTPRQMTLVWLAQTMHWTVIAVAMRGVVVAWAYLFRHSVGRSAVLLGSWACDRQQQDAKTFLNIVILPIILDWIQITVQSFALKPTLANLPADSRSRQDRLPNDIGVDASVASVA
eukprot:m.105445 g.105445  ORF g.105445 m.105445 type:complete len:389 (+) comp10549_c1_seq5:8297-9463(+)